MSGSFLAGKPREADHGFKNAYLLRCAASFVTAAYAKVRLIPQDLRALQLSIFEQPVWLVTGG
jgi:hypothetical protein